MAQTAPEVKSASNSIATNEILLRGQVTELDADTHRLTLQVASFTLPNGRSATLRPARPKTVWLAGDVVYYTRQSRQFLAEPGGWNRLAIGSLVAVVGRDSGTGQPLTARRVEIDDRPGAAPLLPKPATVRPPGDTAWSARYGGVRPWVADSGVRVGKMFKVRDFSGRSPRGNPNSDHPRGLALDYMVYRDARKGDAIASYFLKNAARERVLYIIWKDTLVYPGREIDWSLIPVDYSHDVTRRHMDHVHVSYLAE